MFIAEPVQFFHIQPVHIYLYYLWILLVHKLLVVPIAFNEKKQKINSWTKMENTKSNTLMTFLVEKFAKLRTCWWFWIAKSKKNKVEVVKAFLFLGEKLKMQKSKKRKVKKKRKVESRKVEKSKKKKRSKSRKVPRPGDLCSKSRKHWKFKIQKAEKSKSRKVEHFLIFREKFHLKSRKIKSSKSRKSKSRKVEHFLIFGEQVLPEKSKKSKSQKSKPVWLFGLSPKVSLKSRKSRKVKKSNLFDFLDFCEKLCNFRAVRLPARGAVSQTYALPGFQLTNEETNRLVNSLRMGPMDHKWTL